MSEQVRGVGDNRLVAERMEGATRCVDGDALVRWLRLHERLVVACGGYGVADYWGNRVVQRWHLWTHRVGLVVVM